MIVQAGVIPLILCILGITSIAPNTWGRWLIDISVWITVFITVISGIPYVTAALRAAKGT
jgi:uncharacterized protein (DUF983 family)